MTKTNACDEEDFEILPQTKTLDLPLGIRCMELNVQEVDDAIRQFTKKSEEITSPSWKFPHVTLEKLDVNHVMNVLRSHTALKDKHLYMELMELLIDRLYYAIITSYEFVNGLEAAFVNADSPPKKDSKKRSWDPLEIAKKSVEDNTPKPFHTANIGMLVRQFCTKMLGLENIVLNNIASKKVFSTVLEGTCKTVQHTECQTDISLQDGCDSCFIAQNILKLVADQIDTSLRTFNQSDSSIAKVRLDLKKDAFSITQRGALLRWLDALETDCSCIASCANMLLDFNVKSQDSLRSLKENSEIESERSTKEIVTLQEKLTRCEEDLKLEKDARAKISKLKDASVIKLNEMEKLLEKKGADLGRITKERDTIQKSFTIAEELNHQLKSNLCRCTADLDKYKEQLKLETKKNLALNEQVKSLSDGLAQSDKQISRLSEAEQVRGVLEQEKATLTKEVGGLKKALQRVETNEKEAKKLAGEKDAKINQLAAELKNCHSKIEVLTLYPDLNGPLNTPMKAGVSSSSCVETMEMQIKSNQIRMEILRAQSARLSATVTKLRDHMKSKGKMELIRGAGATVPPEISTKPSQASSNSSF